MITFVLIRMLSNENNQHFNIFECGHIHTCGVVLHRFPSSLQFSAIFNYKNERKTSTNLFLTHSEVHIFLKLVGIFLQSVFETQVSFEAAKTMLKLQ